MMRTNSPGERRQALRQWPVRVCVMGLALSLLLLLLPAGQQSAKALCNRIFAASEAVNHYAYEWFPVPEGAEPALAAGTLLADAGLLTLLAWLAPGDWLSLTLAVALAAGQAYLGLSLPAFVNVVWFGALGGSVVFRRAGRQYLPAYAAAAVLVALLVTAACPGQDAGIEAASERARDWLGAVLERPMPENSGQEDDLLATRHENRRDLREGDGAGRVQEEYRLVTVEEQQIALPHWIDYLRIILLCLLIPAALAAPFVPFVWMNRQRARTAGKYACLDLQEDAVAITGIFALVIEYLDARHVGERNALYTERLAACEGLPQAYVQRYQHAAALWQEAAYSDHPMQAAQREELIALLEETERLFYDQADWQTRLRLRYVCCLHE